MAIEEPPAPPPQPASRPVSAWPRVTAWILGVLAAVALGVAGVVSVGLAVVLCAPAVVFISIFGWSIWSARRRRQTLENRDENELKDPLHAKHPWPTEGVIDDRLPLP